MTYAEFLTAQADDTLNRKVRVAVLIAADAIRAEIGTTPNHVARVAWAKATFNNPGAAAVAMIGAVLAANIGATLAVVLAASDATVQTAVNAAVDVLT
jgi:hypothetical protein